MTNHLVRIHRQGPPSVLSYEVADPVGEPAAGQVRLKQDAIGLNFVDTMFRDGTFKVSLPFDMGVEAAGVVEAVGPGVRDHQVGDRVAYFFAPGAYAGVRLIAADALLKLPDDLSTQRAAAVLAKGLTAWMAVRRAHAVQPGEVVYANGVTGGVGLLVALWAASLDATVICAVGSSEKAVRASKLGLKNVLVTSDADFTQRLNALTNGRGADVVYELVGKATFAQSVALLRSGGDLIHIGNASGPAAVDGAQLAARSIRYLQPSTPQYVGDRATLNEATGELFAALRSGVFGELKIAQYRLSDVVRAHEDIAQRRTFGLSILIP